MEFPRDNSLIDYPSIAVIEPFNRAQTPRNTFLRYQWLIIVITLLFAKERKTEVFKNTIEFRYNAKESSTNYSPAPSDKSRTSSASSTSRYWSGADDL